MGARGLLIAGTDTGVGKTTVAQGLLRLAQRNGFRLIPYKPSETGCAPDPEDARRLCAAAAITGLTPQDVCPYPLALPVAPALAARLAGTSISRQVILDRGSELLARGDALLIESAGGLLTPYGPSFTSADLADMFDISVLLVSANRLGTISQTALALSELRRRNLRFAGLILVQVSPDSPAPPDQAHNASEILTLTGVRALGILRHCPEPDADRLADALEQDVALDTVLDGALRSAPQGSCG